MTICATLFIPEADFIAVLNGPAVEYWTAMEDPVVRVIHIGKCGMALLSHAYLGLQAENIIVIVDELVDTLKHVVDITEELVAKSRTDLKDTMVAMSMDIQMPLQPRHCKCAYRDIAYYLEPREIILDFDDWDSAWEAFKRETPRPKDGYKSIDFKKWVRAEPRNGRYYTEGLRAAAAKKTQRWREEDIVASLRPTDFTKLADEVLNAAKAR